MSQQNRISNVIPQPVNDQVMDHIAQIKLLLTPYLHPLTVDERSGLTKMGDKSQPFVKKTLEYSKINTAFVAPSIDVVEWQKDFDGWEDLVPIKNQLAQALSDVDDTIMLLGVEAYDPARWYYDLVKIAAHRGDMSAKPIAEDLAKRYASIKRKK